MKLPLFTAASNTEEDKRLFICRETAEWLKEKKVKWVGFGDGVSVESNNELPIRSLCPMLHFLLKAWILVQSVRRQLKVNGIFQIVKR
jgi:hypothetical protein